MTPVGGYGQLLRLDRPVITTSEAAAIWQTSGRTAGRRLEAMDEDGLVHRLRRGLWALDLQIVPFAVAPFLTAPFPAYISFWSAFARHEMIEQIPRQISIASLDRARTITTSLGSYEIHHLAPELFGGFEGSEASGYLATPEKALFDAVYVRAASGTRAFFPELSLPTGFKDRELEKWTERIESARLRTLVSRRLGEVLTASQREGASRASSAGHDRRQNVVAS
jgi:predicted transcriptional regulator of viral defense system